MFWSIWVFGVSATVFYTFHVPKTKLFEFSNQPIEESKSVIFTSMFAVWKPVKNWCCIWCDEKALIILRRTPVEESPIAQFLKILDCTNCWKKKTEDLSSQLFSGSKIQYWSKKLLLNLLCFFSFINKYSFAYYKNSDV